MDFLLRSAYPIVLMVGIPFILLCIYFRYRYYKPITYRFSLVQYLYDHHYIKRSIGPKILFCLRSLLLIVLVVLISRIQVVDTKSTISVDGVDIMLVLDVSGSMLCFDDLKDQRTRIEVAKQEAMNFIARRTNDPIGLVLFAKDALSRCPLTLDKHILQDIIKNIDIGIIDHNGTLLATGIALAANRLKSSTARSKIMIVLTDGEPSPEDMPMQDALMIAKELGIKIYTIGIGNEQESYVNYGPWGVQRVQVKLNKSLLQHIAQETHGKFFYAQRPEDMQKIYHTIDKLEKTTYETPLYTKYYELIIPLIFIALLLIALEIFLHSLIWFGL